MSITLAVYVCCVCAVGQWVCNVASDVAVAAIVQRDVDNVAEKGLDLSDTPQCDTVTDDVVAAVLDGGEAMCCIALWLRSAVAVSMGMWLR